MQSLANGSGWILFSKILQHINLPILRSGLAARQSIHRIPHLTDPGSSGRRHN
jgi:hypothetical protein